MLTIIKVQSHHCTSESQEGLKMLTRKLITNSMCVHTPSAPHKAFSLNLVLYKYDSILSSLQVKPFKSNHSTYEIGRDLSNLKMKSITSLIVGLCLSITALPLIQASPLATRASTITPTRPFSVSAFESPYPVGQGITGLNMTAYGGSFYLSSKGKRRSCFSNHGKTLR